jgi:predicted enzyme related to lactoylglutathione lyase
MTASRFCWFDYMGDAAKAQGFFGELFGWTKKDVPIGNGHTYTMIALGDETIGGYGVGKGKGWLAHLLVDDIKAAAAKVTSLGGKLEVAPMAMGPGQYAVAADPLGAAFALWQPGKPEEGKFSEKVGGFCWNELTTSDAEKSVAFYTALAGVEDHPMDMGPMGTYHVLKSHGADRGGIVKSPMPTGWLPYVHVAHADDTVAKAKRLGATVLVGPASIPNVGRLAVFADPQGATMGILQP